MEVDFYYSQQAFDSSKKDKLLRYFMGLPEKFIITKFKSQIYTECIYTGKEPISEWSDLVYLGTGTFDDITYERLGVRTKEEIQTAYK